MAKEAVEVREATPAEQAEVRAFIDEGYLARFGTRPPYSDVYFVARTKRGEIVGSMALDFCMLDGIMPLHKAYRFDAARAPFPTAGALGAQFGRWIARLPHISAPLLYRAVVTAIERGKRYAWCEHTDAVHRVVERMGPTFTLVPGATLDLEGIAPENRAFYQETLKEDPMRLYLTPLTVMRQGLEERGLPRYRALVGE